MGFILGGKATFTLKSEKTGKHYTYKVTEADSREGSDWTSWFVANLTDGDKYHYLGMIGQKGESPPSFRPKHDGANAKGFGWFFKKLSRGEETPQLEFWHEGSCCKCGRALTNPESIQTGIGPVCKERS
jgi:hypothetical protein